MRLRRFEYHEAGSVAEAIDLADRHGDEARLLAGGTALLLMIRYGIVRPAHVVSLERLDELRGIRRDGDVLRIGALTAHADLAASPDVRAHGRCCHGGRRVATRDRQHGTIGANSATRSASDPARAARLGDRAVLEGRSGRRSSRRGVTWAYSRRSSSRARSSSARGAGSRGPPPNVSGAPGRSRTRRWSASGCPRRRRVPCRESGSGSGVNPTPSLQRRRRRRAASLTDETTRRLRAQRRGRSISSRTAGRPTSPRGSACGDARARALRPRAARGSPDDIAIVRDKESHTIR